MGVRRGVKLFSSQAICCTMIISYYMHVVHNTCTFVLYWKRDGIKFNWINPSSIMLFIERLKSNGLFITLKKSMRTHVCKGHMYDKTIMHWYVLLVAVFLGCTSTGRVGIWFVVFCLGAPEGSTGSVSGFKASQKTRQRLKVSSDSLREAGNRTCDPWFTRYRFIPCTTAVEVYIV